jgi:hypothetical protein
VVVMSLEIRLESYSKAFKNSWILKICMRSLFLKPFDVACCTMSCLGNGANRDGMASKDLAT